MAPGGIKFNASRFAKSFIGRRASKQMELFLDALGTQNIVYAITKNKDLVDYLPQQKLESISGAVEGEVAQAFTDEDVYSWLPSKYRVLIGSQPNGRAWAMRQIAFLRSLLVAS